MENYPENKVHGAHLGPVGPRRAPCWPHEPCYQGTVACWSAVLWVEIAGPLLYLHYSICLWKNYTSSSNISSMYKESRIGRKELHQQDHIHIRHTYICKYMLEGYIHNRQQPRDNWLSCPGGKLIHSHWWYFWWKDNLMTTQFCIIETPFFCFIPHQQMWF